MKKQYPFVWGAQYHRAPTPEARYWRDDLKKMRELGFNSVKYWVQWRWSQRTENSFYFDDTDQLMDMAAENGLMVTLNLILDVAPVWLYRKYPDAKMILNDGTVVEPYAVGHRQIGGHPGPCYNHPGAREERIRFLRETFVHFNAHPALTMWDVWNEPELCFPQRYPVKTEKLACYCDNCRQAFTRWLERKYGSLEHLNRVWGRCYLDWDEVEMPRGERAINDFVDWREFHVETMTAEASMRLRMAAEYSPDKINYLHVVPNDLNIWNTVSCCSDDFDMAKECDVFASTMNGGAMVPKLVLSGARGKVCYNVESHLNFGEVGMHQRKLELPMLLKDFLPQLGMGIKGFMFWQYRPESLGTEAPAWGVINPDGSDRPITGAIREFSRRLEPHFSRLMQSFTLPCEVAILKSRRNELFHYCAGKLAELGQELAAYCDAFYWNNRRYEFINSEILVNGGLGAYRMLVLPSPYLLSEAEAEAVRCWVESGGILLSEAHIGGYDDTIGRHSENVPGLGLDKAWAFHEFDSRSPLHLPQDHSRSFADAAVQNDDVKKAMTACGCHGGKYFPVMLKDGALLLGGGRYAGLSGEGITSEGEFESGIPCVISRSYGKGKIYYCACNPGVGASEWPEDFQRFIGRICRETAIPATLNITAEDAFVHVDALFFRGESQPAYVVMMNRDKREAEVELELESGAVMTGIFSGLVYEMAAGVNKISVSPELTDIFIVK